MFLMGVPDMLQASTEIKSGWQMGASACHKGETPMTITHNTFFVCTVQCTGNRPSGSIDTGVYCDTMGPSSAVFGAVK